MEVAQSPANSTDNLWPLDRTSIWKPLDKEKREIRILLVQPSEEEDDALYADLEIVSLDSEPEYKAISYVWGDASDTTVMFVNGGKVIEITRSLAAALRRFRDSKVFVALWADAVCINQADLQERADQVRIMGKIYASAIQVNVWLGRVSDRGWHDALHGYLEVEDQPRTEGILQANEGFFEYSFSEVHEDLDIGTHWLGLEWWAAWIKILSLSPWFSRLWVIQEAAFARSAVFFGGRHRCTHDVLYSISYQVASLSTRGLRKPPFLSDAYHQIFAAVQAREMAFTTGCCEIMRLFSHLNCQNGSDKVYGLLGLSSTMCDFPIDYGKSTEGVFVEFATSCIAKEGTGETFISSTCGKKPSKLPSWVPDWRGGFLDYHIAFSKSATLHDACPANLDGLSFEQYFKVDRGELKISAMIVDRVDTCGPTFIDSARSETHVDPGKLQALLGFKLFRRWQKHFQEFQEVLLPVIMCNAWDDRDAHEIRRITPADFEKVECFWTLFENAQDAGADPTLVPRDSNIMFLEACINAAQLFLTTSGRLGNAKIGVRAGDLVAVFPECRLPFIIRPVEDVDEKKGFELISPCYIHGMMNGEAFWHTFTANSREEEIEAAMHDVEAINEILSHEKGVTGAGSEETRELWIEVTKKYFRNLFEEITLV